MRRNWCRSASSAAFVLFSVGSAWALQLAGRGGNFSAEAYVAHVKYLASDELGGRGTGSDGIRQAGEYAVEKFKAAGLLPAGDDGTYYQQFEVRSGKHIDRQEAALALNGFDGNLALGENWAPMPFGYDDEKQREFDGPLAFAGYGIEAPDFEFNDYQDFDAKGKVLIVLRHEPRADDDEAKFGGKERSEHALFTTKAQVAAKHGAKALLIVNPPEETDDALYGWEGEFRQTMKLPMAHIKRELADALLKQAGQPGVAELAAKLRSERKSLSTDLKGMAARFSPGVKVNMLQARNVIAMLPGDGSTDEIIVVGAHYDHLGTAPKMFGGGSGKAEIHNGADDNASGTSGVLELARVFGGGSKLHRNVVFMLFSGEERGLLGSDHFVNHPTFDLSRVKAMVNLDMIGRMAQDKLEVYGLDTAEGFEELVAGAAEPAGITYKKPKRSQGVFGQSDHFSFYKKNIPIIFAFTGLHKQYHQPEDDWDLIDGEGAAKLLGVLHTIITDLAQRREGPEFLKIEKKEPTDKDNAAATPGDDAKAERPAVSARSRLKVRMGIMPSYAEDDVGVLVDGLADEAGPAGKAGIKAGDRITKIGDRDIKNMYDYMDALGKFNPGDSTEIVLTRDGKPVTVKITFDAAPRARGRD